MLEDQPDPHHNYEILFKWSANIFLEIKFCFTFGCQMCLKITLCNIGAPIMNMNLYISLS